MTSNDRTLYRNKARSMRVRVVAWFLIGAGLAGLAATWNIYATYGLAPGDGGVLRPWSERAAFAGVLGALSLATIASAIALAARYVSAIRETRQGKARALDIVTVGLFRPQTRGLPRDGGTWRKFAGNIYTSYTSAPYALFRPAKTLVPYVVDLQAEQVSLSDLRRRSRG